MNFKLLIILLASLYSVGIHSQEFERESSAATESIDIIDDDNSLIAIHTDTTYSIWTDNEFINHANTTSSHNTISIGEDFIYTVDSTLSIRQGNEVASTAIDYQFDSIYTARLYKGLYWIGTDNGIWTWDKIELNQVDIGSVYNDQKIRWLEVYGEDLWYAVGNAVFNWNDNLSPIVMDDNIKLLYKPQHRSLKKKLFIQTSAGFYFGSKGDFKRIFIPEIGQVNNVVSIAENQSTIYIADRDLGIITWNTSGHSYQKIRNSIFDANQINDLLIGPYGSLWVATDVGVYRQNLNSQSKNTPPKLSITEYKINGKTVTKNKLKKTAIGDVIQLKLDVDHWMHPQKISTTYQNYDGGPWTAIGNATNIMHKTTIQDEYILIKTTVDGTNYNYSERVALSVDDDSWLVYLYALLGLVALLLLIGLLALNANKNTITALQKDAKNLRSENKALKHEQKALQLQMNPHFLFNALNSIQGLISIGEGPKARKALKQFSSIMRQVLDHSRVDRIAIQDELHYLRRYLELEQMIREDAFSFAFIIDDQIMQEDLILPMIIQPFVENAIIHGVAPLTDRKGTIEIKMNVSDHNKLVDIYIIDNGAGLNHRNKSATHQSVATKVVTDRLQANKDAHLSINNRYEGKSVIGTIVHIKMPTFIK